MPRLWHWLATISSIRSGARCRGLFARIHGLVALIPMEISLMQVRLKYCKGLFHY